MGCGHMGHYSGYHRGAGRTESRALFKAWGSPADCRAKANCLPGDIEGIGVEQAKD